MVEWMDEWMDWWMDECDCKMDMLGYLYVWICSDKWMDKCVWMNGLWMDECFWEGRALIWMALLRFTLEVMMTHCTVDLGLWLLPVSNRAGTGSLSGIIITLMQHCFLPSWRLVGHVLSCRSHTISNRLLSWSRSPFCLFWTLGASLNETRLNFFCIYYKWMVQNRYKAKLMRFLAWQK